MEGEEFDALVADIKANDLREPIVLHDGMIVDGRNRWRALERLNIKPHLGERKYFRTMKKPGSFELRDAPDDEIVRRYVISKNIHRRHLKPEKKLEIIADLIKAAPDKSDRQIAATAKVSPTTVGKKRAEMEAKGEVSTVDTRTDARGVKQPARKKAASKKDADELEASTGQSDLRDGFLLDCEVAAEVADTYKGPIDDDVRRACRNVAAAFTELADRLDRDAAAPQVPAAA
jgi:ParB-like chromosome segregation protein Spo0J